MNRSDLEATFDRQAATYDQQWARMAALRDAMHLLMASVFGELPREARMLCVGAGTGAEIHFLASRFPAWNFVAVEPSAGMVSAAMRRAEQHGYADRCVFHTGYLDTLPGCAPFDCATSLLVSQFLLDPAERVGFFGAIAARLRPGGVLVAADLASGGDTRAHASLLKVWMATMAAAELTPQRLQLMREAYDRDVSIVPPRDVAAIITSAGFDEPVQFFQAGLIHAWYAERTAVDAVREHQAP